MEQHPVPQNVTTFQFRLIGDMTIKQFGYLAGGAIAAYVTYKLPVPFFFSWPLAFAFAVGGIGFAFVPVEERPMDVWVMSFIKNIYSPTQFVWSHQAGEKPAPAPQATSGAPATTLAATPAPPNIQARAAEKPVTDVLQRIFTPQAPPPTSFPTSSVTGTSVMTARGAAGPFDWLFKLFAPPAIKPAAQTPAAIPTPSITGRHLDISAPPKVTPAPPTKPARTAQAEKREEELATKATEIAHALEEKTQTHARILELQKQLTEVLAERDRMRDEVAALRVKTAQQQAPAAPSAPSVAVPTPTIPPTASRASAVATPPVPIGSGPAGGPTVKIITPEGAVKAGLPRLTTFPNVVTGITRDSDNNLLPGVLVTIRDKDGVPVRALKTNRLGQFAASTPITNGTYLVEIEDPRGRYVFDRAQVTLNGSIVPALEIIAKSQRDVAREKLAKEIFGS